jgi:methylated-DNA-[protein]-cysteine S-methyltransferase
VNQKGKARMTKKKATGNGCAIFKTCFGPCAIAWRGRAIAGISLPESSARATIVKLRSRAGPAPELSPPGWVRKVIHQIQGHLLGRRSDFGKIVLAFEQVTPFARKVYQAARQIGPGETVTYGQLAALAGSPRAARAVGNALAQNPFPLVVPCHRIVAASSRPGGFSAFGGLKTKARLLTTEGVTITWLRSH